jgi:hypothetical protein
MQPTNIRDLKQKRREQENSFHETSINEDDDPQRTRSLEEVCI